MELGPRKRVLDNYISAFDDNFKVNLDIEDSPSITAHSQRTVVNMIQPSQSLTKKFSGILILASTFLYVSACLLWDLNLIPEGRISTIVHYLNDLPHLFIILIFYLFISLTALKVFKHN